MPLTKEAKREYLETKGTACPFCGSEQLDGGFVEIDGGHAYQPMSCLEGGKQWSDVYVLDDMEER